MRVALLDDYQGVALQYLATLGRDDRLTSEAFADHLSDPDALVERLAAFEVVVAMRERTAFTRDVLARLPRLRLLVTTGMRNAAIDEIACAEFGVTLCGTNGSVQSTSHAAPMRRG